MHQGLIRRKETLPDKRLIVKSANLKGNEELEAKLVVLVQKFIMENARNVLISVFVDKVVASRMHLSKLCSVKNTTLIEQKSFILLSSPRFNFFQSTKSHCQYYKMFFKMAFE